jgi:hypothetical protein
MYMIIPTSVLLISNEKISDPAIVVKGVSSPRAEGTQTFQ